MVRSYRKKVDLQLRADGRSPRHPEHGVVVVARIVEGSGVFSSRRRRTTDRMTIEEASERHIDAKPVQFPDDGFEPILVEHG